ncbi:MAG: Soluble lytic murein transglycosylase and related regulatory protein [Acidobacteria bacterium]|nr:Soluble lytic murein transglycosylase and related regulatory protein [Acidobacteriota bacterium]
MLNGFEDFARLADNPLVPFKVTRRQTLLFFLLVLFATSVLAQSPQDRSDKIRSAVERGDHSAALVELKALRTANPAPFTLNNFDYLFARLLERRGDHAGAAAGYQSVVARRSLLSQYALWHLAQLARSTGDLVSERERLRQLTITVPGSLLRDAATIRLAESFSESKDYPAVISTLRPLTESKNASIARQALMLSGESWLKAGKSNEAREIFKRLVANLPDAARPDDFALAAVRGLDALDKSQTGSLSEQDHLQRANVYQFNRDFAGARIHYLAVVERTPESASLPDALYQIGRGFYQEAKYDEALKYLRRVSADYNSSASARDALALIAGTLTRQKQTDQAVSTYKQIIELYPTAPSPERPYLNIIDVLRDAGRVDEALSWSKQTREHFKDQLGGTLALFAQARIHLAQDSWPAAVSDLDELLQSADLGGARVSGGTNKSEVLFLRALALEQLGRAPEAVEVYLSIPAGRNEYYGFRADERVRALDENPRSHQLIADKTETLSTAAKRQWEAGETEAARRAAQSALRLETEAGKRRELLDLLRRVYESSPAYKFPAFKLLSPGRVEMVSTAPKNYETMPTHEALAKELLFLGLYDEAAPEMSAAQMLKGTDQTATAGKTPQNDTGTAMDAAYTLAVYFLRGDNPYPAVRFSEQTWRNIPSDYQIELAPRPLLEMLYPAAYRNSVLKYAPPRQLDPRFVLAIARQETRFHADAKSVAAARGLMQFIAATAIETAKELGRQDFQQDELYNPDSALEFGSQYLASLFQQFPNQPQAVAAAYNGGADNIARWIARSHSQDADRYVPEIGFAQSKDYVFRVLSNFWVYRSLYNEQLQAQP